MKNNERSLLFIDPYGYKEFDVDFIASLLKNQKTEVIFFVLIYFMYRFANKAIHEDFPGGEPLKKLIEKLSPFEPIDTKSQVLFIEWMKRALRKYLNIPWVTTFTIEREQGHYFSLFFFTSNSLGYEKMLEAKWKFDEQNGRGFKINPERSGLLFGSTEINEYERKLSDYIKFRKEVTNRDLYEFGLENESLPSHTNECLKKFYKNDEIERFNLDGSKARAFYTDNKDVMVKIKSKQWHNQV